VKKMSQKEQRELAECEAAITSLESEIAAMEGELSNPETFVKLGAGTNDFIAKLDAKKHELEGKFSRWAELEEVRVACAG
jgi:ATP-binding cassette subfamily F protein uup